MDHNGKTNRWEVVSEPVVIDGKDCLFRATLTDHAMGTEKSWTGRSRDDVVDTARDAAHKTEVQEAHMRLPVLTESFN